MDTSELEDVVSVDLTKNSEMEKADEAQNALMAKMTLEQQ